MPVENEAVTRQTRNFDRILQVIVEKTLDALVDRAEMLGEQAVPFVVERHESAGEIGEFRVELQRENRQPEVTQFEIRVVNEPLGRFGVLASPDNAAQTANAFFQLRVGHALH